MKNYAISIGGSGARCMEALVYLCAAGIGPQDQDLTLVFVDPDTNNGNLKATVELVKLYEKLQPEKQDGYSYLGTRVTTKEPQIWSPFEGPKPTLKDFFSYETLRASESGRDAAYLMEVLYTHGQREATLDVGFRGKPSIGAAVFSESVNFAQKAPWRQLAEEIAQAVGRGEQANIFAVGSVFGGTGAAGIPTIPRLMTGETLARNPKIALGCTLLLPYFTYSVPSGVADEVYAHPDLFMLNSKEALRYYRSFEETYNRVYVLGAESQAGQEWGGVGGEKQRNLPHFIDFLAGLAALNFFASANPTEHRVCILAVDQKNCLKWTDIPDQDNVHPKVAKFARSMFFYLKLIWPRLLDIREGATGVQRTPWYVDLFEKKKLQVSDSKTYEFLQDQAKFASLSLRWLRDMQKNQGGFTLELVNSLAIEDPDDPKSGLKESVFDKEFMFQGAGKAPKLSRMWGNLCCIADKGLPPTIGTLRALQVGIYESCS